MQLLHIITVESCIIQYLLLINGFAKAKASTLKLKCVTYLLLKTLPIVALND